MINYLINKKKEFKKINSSNIFEKKVKDERLK